MKKMVTYFSGIKGICSILFLSFFLMAGAGKAQVLVSESFDGATFPPTGWTTANVVGTNSVSYTNNWSAVATGAYNPTGITPHSGAKMAYYESYWNQTGAVADLVSPAFSLNFVGGVNYVTLWVYQYNSFTYSDAISVYINTTASSTGGTLLGTITPNSTSAPTGWISYTYTIPSTFTSATNYVVFKAYSGYGYDMFMDDVSVTHFVPCAGKPSAGAIAPVTPCPNTNFNLTLTGAPASTSGLTFQWQSAAAATGPWTNLGTTASITQNIPTSAYYRAIVTCTASSQSDTTAPYQVILAPFLNCYCANAASYNYYGSVGRVVIRRMPSGDTILKNGTATPLQGNTTSPTYSNFAFGVNAVTPPNLYPDSTYSISITVTEYYTSFYAANCVGYIDYNHSGTFDPSEQIINLANTSPTQEAHANFTVPHAALYGLTGMRALAAWTAYTWSICGTYSYGETEDYLVNINLPPCSGPTNAGTIVATDSNVCIGYPFSLADATHEKLRSFISWSWQYSTNGGNSYLDVANSTGVDSLNNLTLSTSTKYRVRMICQSTKDTTYSNIMSVNIGQPWQCYCYSIATGGKTNDSSDIGSVTIGKFTSTASGPHLDNPVAVRGRTDYTTVKGPELYADSTYRLSLYHIMKGFNHADARISVFLDYNNNFQYDLQGANGYSPELIYTGVTTAANWYLDTYIKIPHMVIPDVPTGMRVILNNDVNPTAQANLGCGAYVSGETEDYVVTFRRPRGVGVLSTGNNLKNVSMYPNPTDGQFTLALNATTSIKELNVVVTTITGQQVMTKTFTDAGTSFTTGIDLRGQAKGIYFVTLHADGDKLIKKLIVQ